MQAPPTGLAGTPATEQRAPRPARRDFNRGPRRDDRNRNSEPSDGPTMIEKVVFINRCAKVVKGGRRFSFSALVVSGDKIGKVGLGFGKANEVSDCIRKASDASRKDLMEIKMDGSSIPHEVIGEFGVARTHAQLQPGHGVIS